MSCGDQYPWSSGGDYTDLDCGSIAMSSGANATADGNMAVFGSGSLTVLHGSEIVVSRPHVTAREVNITFRDEVTRALQVMQAHLQDRMVNPEMAALRDRIRVLEARLRVKRARARRVATTDAPRAIRCRE